MIPVIGWILIAFAFGIVIGLIVVAILNRNWISNYVSKVIERFKKRKENKNKHDPFVIFGNTRDTLKDQLEQSLKNQVIDTKKIQTLDEFLKKTSSHPYYAATVDSETNKITKIDFINVKQVEEDVKKEMNENQGKILLTL